MEPLLPLDVCEYEHQITGYGGTLPIKSGPDPVGQFLYSPTEHCVYKPVQEPPKGPREVEFYCTVFGAAPLDSTNGEEASVSQQQQQQLLSALRCYLSTFLGVYRHPLTGRRYMRLRDLLYGFSRPSVMDLKMGVRRHEPSRLGPNAGETRPDRYAHRQQTGFFVTGLRVWRQEAGRYELYSKRHGREVTPANMHVRVLQPLLSGAPPSHRLRLLRLIAARLDGLRRWFESQRVYHFYASSILLGVESCPEALLRASDPVVVRMVDFTHVVPAEGGRPDEGFLLGLRNLLRLCRDCERATSAAAAAAGGGGAERRLVVPAPVQLPPTTVEAGGDGRAD